MARRLTTLFVFLFCSGCATYGAISLDNLDVSMQDLQKLVSDNLPISLRSQSINGREFFSDYFIVNKGEFEKFEEQPVRYYAHIYIMGDRRPYRIDTLVVREHRVSGGKYEQIKFESTIAKTISRRMQQDLHKRRGERNIIDDFRAF